MRITQRQRRESWEMLLFQREPKMRRVESDRARNVPGLVSNAMHVLYERVLSRARVSSRFLGLSCSRHSRTLLITSIVESEHSAIVAPSHAGLGWPNTELSVALPSPRRLAGGDAASPHAIAVRDAHEASMARTKPAPTEGMPAPVPHGWATK
jgi:hypothetical protein